MNDSGKIDDIESIRSGKLSHVPIKPAVVPSPCCMLSRDQILRSDTWNLPGTQGNVVGNPLSMLDSSQTPHQGIPHLANLSATGAVQRSTGRPVAKGEERFGSTTTPMSAGRASSINSFPPFSPPLPRMVSPLVVGGRGQYCGPSPGAPIVGSWSRGVPSGSGRGPQPCTIANNNDSRAACRDEKLMNVSDVKASDEERHSINRVASEIVFQALHPDTGAPLYKERVTEIREESNLHKIFLRDATGAITLETSCSCRA